mmetsp:Transcript_26587/g.56552  ORF Transcript_26587/g.56552 Transcript_26587/m.56552 type:complete len:319 (-) Transcript_26587:334-1290(-)
MDRDSATTTATSDAPAAGPVKTIYIIRHGVAVHNVPDPRTGERPNLLDPKYADPPLIRQGELQARVLGEHLRRRGMIRGSCGIGPGGSSGRIAEDEDAMDAEGGGGGSSGDSDDPPPIELVVCSPLTRCLQTASHVFPSHFEGDAEASPGRPAFSKIADDDGNDLHVLRGDCRVCCHGDAREAFGMHYPDKRSPLSLLSSRFPAVAYHPSLAEHDLDWKHDTRETREDVSRRIRKFFVWLSKQPHDNVAIVTHGVWAECALLEYCPEVLEYGRRRVYNCDVYRGRLSVRRSLADGNDQNGHVNAVELNDVQQLSFYHA